jgi:hypothetical protein
MTEPKVRKDGTCVVCRRPIETVPRPGVPPLLYVDPFCSSACAKAYFDVTMSAEPMGRPRKYEQKK